MGMLACLATSNSNVAWESWCPSQATLAALLRKCERLQIAGSQKKLAWKAVAQPHLPMALLAQRHRDWGCLLVLSPQASNVLSVIPCRMNPAALLRKSERLQIARNQKELACKAVAQPHLPMELLAQRHRECGCLLVLPTQSFKRILGGPCRMPTAALLRKCERVQIARRQKELAWKAVAQPHLPMALLAKRHRDWGCLLFLPHQTSNVC